MCHHDTRIRFKNAEISSRGQRSRQIHKINQYYETQDTWSRLATILHHPTTQNGAVEDVMNGHGRRDELQRNGRVALLLHSKKQIVHTVFEPNICRPGSEGPCLRQKLGGHRALSLHATQQKSTVWVTKPSKSNSYWCEPYCHHVVQTLAHILVLYFHTNDVPQIKYTPQQNQRPCS